MLIFVYGSLKRGYKYNYVLDNISKFISEVTTVEKFSLYRYKDSDFPYLSLKENEKVKGELFEVLNIKDIDQLEGYPLFYDRKEIEVETAEGFKYKALVYFLKEKIKEKEKPIKEWTLKEERWTS